MVNLHIRGEVEIESQPIALSAINLFIDFAKQWGLLHPCSDASTQAQFQLATAAVCGRSKLVDLASLLIGIIGKVGH